MSSYISMENHKNYHKHITSKYTIKKYINEEFQSLLNDSNIECNITNHKLDTKNRLSKNVKSHSEMNDILSKTNNTIQEIVKISIDMEDEIKNKIMNLLLDTTFIPFTIVSWIELCCDNCSIITWDNVTVYILDDKPIDINMINDITKIIKWIVMISGHENPELNIFIYLCKEKKRILDRKNLGIQEINSGVSLTGTWLQIFRKEELYKVLIHELLHNMHMYICYFVFE